MSINPVSSIPRPDYANHPAYGKLFVIASLGQRREAMKRFWPEFRNALRTTQYARKRRSTPRERTTPLYEQLNRDGVVPLTIPDQVMDRLHPLIEPHVQEVREKRAAFAPKERKFE